MVIGRGFVRSGSGFVSTPATRAAARAAGTFGSAGYEGAIEAARRLNIALSKAGSFAEGQAIRAAHAATPPTPLPAIAADKPCPKGNEYHVVFPDISCPIGYRQEIKSDGLWCVCDMWKSKVPTPTPPPETSPPTPGVSVCPRGLRYTKLTRWSECDAGYLSTKGSGMSILGQDIYPYIPGNECVCIESAAGQAIIKSEGEPKPSDLPDGNGEPRELGDLGKYTPYLLLAAVAGVALSLIKR